MWMRSGTVLKDDSAFGNHDGCVHNRPLFRCQTNDFPFPNHMLAWCDPDNPAHGRTGRQPVRPVVGHPIRLFQWEYFLN
jgi:hypothetical protein